MAEIENVVIFRADTGEAIRTLGDLKESIKFLKEKLDDAEVGTKEYADTLVNLQTQQAALKNAMHDTSYEANSEGDSFAQTAKQAMGLGNSYNALVRQMADLDQQFRATEDTAKRDQLGAQIKLINAQLKEMDAQRGKFGRNVGNYQSALDGLAAGFKATAGAAGSVIPKAQGVTAGLKALSATPVIGVLGLLASALAKIISGLKSSEENTNRMNTALAAFKPLADAATRIVQGLGNAIGKVVQWVADLLVKWGILDEKLAEARVNMEKESQAIVQLERDNMVAVANLRAEIDELREKAAEKDKFNAKQREQFLRDAAAKEEEIFNKEVELAERKLELARQEASTTENSRETNDKLAQLEADLISKRSERAKMMRRLTREINTTLREQGSTARQVTEEILETEETSILSIDDLFGRLEEAERRGDEARAARLKAQEELDKEFDLLYQQQTDAVQAELDAQIEAEWDAMMREREIQQQRLATFSAFTTSLSGLAGALANIYDADADASEEAAEKSKALQIASAIISTIGGAVSAYTSTWSSALPLTAKSILAPINAAAVLAAGYGQVRQIQQVKVGRGSSRSAQAVVAAPMTTITPVQQVRQVTGRTEEERLNQMAAPQRVYIVESDIEKALNDSRVKVAESSW